MNKKTLEKLEYPKIITLLVQQLGLPHLWKNRRQKILIMTQNLLMLLRQA